MSSFVASMYLGQHWRHRQTEEIVRIDMIYRKDRQVKVSYVDGYKEDIGAVEYKNFDLFKKYWTPMEILL